MNNAREHLSCGTATDDSGSTIVVAVGGKTEEDFAISEVEVFSLVADNGWNYISKELDLVARAVKILT